MRRLKSGIICGQERGKTVMESLPYDMIINILNYTSLNDVISFSKTCKQFNEMVNSSQALWRSKLRTIVNEVIFREIEKRCNGNWYNKFRDYMKLKSEVIDRINDMSVYYFKCKKEITLFDIRMIFNKYFCSGFEYYCVIHILQELFAKGNKNTGASKVKPPYTLTDMYYSKGVVRHLLHSYLAIKWMQERKANNLPPERVLNFFIQWVDPLNMHTDEEVNDAINSLVTLVEAELVKNYPVANVPAQNMLASGIVTRVNIVEVISHVLYKDKRLATLSVANLATLDILKVLDMRCGNDVVIATIFHAVAKKFGVNCELLAFPNHLILQVCNTQGPIYKIQLDTGMLVPKVNCPFRLNDGRSNGHKYDPDQFLHYVIAVFLMPLGSYKTWYMQNADYLMEFLNSNPNSDHQYRKYLPYLFEHAHFPGLSTPINIKCITDDHLKIIVLLSYLTNSSLPPPFKISEEEMGVRRRVGSVKFAVGMILQHKVYEYRCVVRDWDRHCSDNATDGQPSARQPFYNVVAMDQSVRYVAQEHLMEVPRPVRLYHLEDMIAKDFTHFNGFAYVLNSLKRAEYPDDQAASDQYRTRAGALYGRKHK